MSVYQVEQYYVYTTGLNLSDDQKTAIIEYLNNEGWSNYEIQEGGQVVVDDFESEGEAQEVEEEIYRLAGL